MSLKFTTLANIELSAIVHSAASYLIIVIPPWVQPSTVIYQSTY